MAKTLAKDPDAVIDFGFDWKYATQESRAEAGTADGWLASGETISSYTITLQSGLTAGTHTNTDGVVTAWVSGGTAGTYYTVACRIVTSQGRTDERTIKLHVIDR